MHRKDVVGSADRRIVRRLPAFAALVALGLTLLPVALPPATAATPAFSRLSGGDRFATAAEISRSEFDPGVSAAFVVTGRDFPDALAAAPAAAKEQAPVLLVEKESIPAVIATELDRLQPANIFVLGGAGAVSERVKTELGRFTDGAVTRISGGDRFSTAAAVSAQFFDPGVPFVFVGFGRNFADALAGGAPAGASGSPILLVERDSVPGATSSELQRLRGGSTRVVILGGTGVVSEGVRQQLNAERWSGGDRFGTSAQVARNAFGGGASRVFLANGYGFADALAGGPVAALARGPVLLVRAGCVPSSVNATIDALNATQAVIFGGAGVVGPDVEDRRLCPEGQGPQTPGLAAVPTAPAFNDDAPDPNLVRFGNSYFTYTTGTTWGNRIGVLVSDQPNTGWRTSSGREFGSTALPTVPDWQVPDTQWAPGVFFIGGRYVMWYAARGRAEGRSCLSVATASQPTGPFTDNTGGPTICQADGNIDPQPFIDADGTPWLHFKNNDEFFSTVSSVWAVQLTRDGTQPVGEPRIVLSKDTTGRPERAWFTTVDNPQMVLANGVHYMFFTAGDYKNATYSVAFATCAGPAGPCGIPRDDTRFLGSMGDFQGPGGGTVTRDTSGQYWMSFHAYRGNCTIEKPCGSDSTRYLYIAPLTFR